jgi:hypothetical protein
MAVPFVGKRMTRKEFADYLDSLKFSSFNPTFVTLHHTASPSLAQRPNGFTAQHLQNLLHYYQNTLGWNGAPHVFVDDQGEGIIVFQRMDKRGVHAASFNNKSWGVEMLGYYDTESFDTGRGKLVRDNAMHALALMCERLDVNADTIKFHRDDPKTSKTCPGTKVKKAYVVNAVQEIINGHDANENAEDYSEWTVIVPGKEDWTNNRVTNGSVIARAKDFATYLVPGSTVKLLQNSKLEWNQGTKTVLLDVADIDENNRAWVSVRQVAENSGYKVTLHDKAIFLDK